MAATAKLSRAKVPRKAVQDEMPHETFPFPASCPGIILHDRNTYRKYERSKTTNLLSTADYGPLDQRHASIASSTQRGTPQPVFGLHRQARRYGNGRQVPTATEFRHALSGKVRREDITIAEDLVTWESFGDWPGGRAAEGPVAWCEIWVLWCKAYTRQPHAQAGGVLMSSPHSLARDARTVREEYPPLPASLSIPRACACALLALSPTGFRSAVGRWPDERGNPSG